jgi:hypothetical protein
MVPNPEMVGVPLPEIFPVAVKAPSASVPPPVCVIV